jgi:hypothetical protein
LFDEALRHSIDPTLYRDRGQCHEKLGNVYPALDDYRAYVSQAPDAADVDTYRKRIESLISTASQDMAPNAGHGGTFDSEMRGGMTDGSTPVTSNPDKVKPDDKDKDTSKTSEDPNKTMTQVEAEEARERETDTSAMRRGTGVILGAYYNPRYVANPWDYKFGQSFGARIGWSFAASSTLILELGYLNQSGDSLAIGNEVKDGLQTFLAYEARIPFDQYATNQLVLAVGGGYEHLTDNLLGQVYGNIVGRGRAGYRHVFGASFALDFYVDGGVIGTFLFDAPTGAQSAGVGGFIGGMVDLSVGF